MTNLTSENNSSNDFDWEMWIDFIEKSVYRDPLWCRVTILFMFGVIFITSLIGNLLTCIVIYYDKTMHTDTNCYLFALAISDLIITFAILLEIPEFFTDTYQYGRLACKLHYFFVVFLWNNSVLIMTTLSVERYIAVFYPLLLSSTSTRRRVIKTIILIIFVAVIETLPDLWTVNLIKTSHTSICIIVPTAFARIINVVLAIVTFAVPLIIMTTMYAMIAFKVSASEKTNSNGKIFNHRNNRSKVNKLVAMTVSFLVCWLPFSSMRVIFSIYIMPDFIFGKNWYCMWIASVNCCWFSIVLNPILFSLISTKFRKALKKLWNGRANKNTFNASHRITHTTAV